MTKQLLLFTFNSKNDINTKIIKLCFLFDIFAIVLLLNTFFITDSVLHDLYIAQGQLDFFYFLPIIIIINAITSVIKNILLILMFTERNIISIKENNFINKK